jgi:hypothetical protein
MGGESRYGGRAFGHWPTQERSSRPTQRRSEMSLVTPPFYPFLAPFREEQIYRLPGICILIESLRTGQWSACFFGQLADFGDHGVFGVWCKKAHHLPVQPPGFVAAF